MEAHEVLSYLKRIPVFRSLPAEGDQELLRLVPHVYERTYRVGETLLSESRVPDKILIILDGRVGIKEIVEGVTPRPRELGQRTGGAILGRTSLEIGDFQKMTVEAIEETHVLELPFRDLIKTYQQSPFLREHLEGPLKPNRLVNTLKTIPLFSDLADRGGELELYQIATITHEQYYANGEWLFRQGETSDRLIYVLAGEIRLTQVDAEGLLHEVDTLQPGNAAGETGLLVGDFHDVTAIAQGYARVIYLLRTEFYDLLQERPYLERKLHVTKMVSQRRNLRQFDWLRDDEWVVAIVQRHWSRLFRQTAALFLIFVLLLPAIVWLLASGSTALLVIAGILAAPLLFLVGGIIYQYINWRDDYFVLTTQRVVHLERVWPLSTHMEESPLENIQDIYEAQPTLSANVMNYGNLVLQTAGETVDIDMSYVPDPDDLRLLISDQIVRARAREVLRTRGQIRDMLARRLQLEEMPEEAEEAPGAGGPSDRVARQRFLPAVFFSSFLQFLFPPSEVKSEGGNTIIWRRFWLPGLIRYSPALIAFLLVTIGGPVLYISSLAAASAGGGISLFPWLIPWLVLEAVLFAVLLWFVEDWRNDFFQLTPSNIILVERQPLLISESRHEARLDRIQNLSYEIPSILGRIFNYGHVQFETAGTQGKFRLKYVRRPSDVQRTISNRQHQFRQRQRDLEANRRQQELLQWFSTYDELHKETGA